MFSWVASLGLLVLGMRVFWGVVAYLCCAPYFLSLLLLRSGQINSVFSCCLRSTSPMLGSFCLVMLHLAPFGFFFNRSVDHMFLDYMEVKLVMIFFSSCEFWCDGISSVAKHKEG